MDEIAVEYILEEVKKMLEEKRNIYASYSVSKVSDEFLMKIAKVLKNWGFKTKAQNIDWVITKRKSEFLVLYYDSGLLHIMYLSKS